MAILRVVGVVLCILVFAIAQNEDTNNEEHEDYQTYSAIETDQQTKPPNLLSAFLEKHTDVCSCVNVPFEANLLKTGPINTRGKDFVAYFEPNCLQKKWKPLYIAVDGHPNNLFDKFELHRFTIRSFGPNPNSKMFKTSCSKNPNVAIMALEMLETDSIVTKPITGSNDSKIALPQNTHQIELFALPYFQDFLLASKITNNCSNILKINGKHQMVSEIRSIRTSECVILFSETNCVGRSTVILSPGSVKLETQWESTVTGLKTLSLLYNTFPDWTWKTKSFKSCTTLRENEGLKVDITEFHINLNAPGKSKILETYEHMCTCQNIPKYIRNLERWSINNNATSMVAYFEQDCTSRTFAPLWIPAGQSSYSIALGAFVKIDRNTNEMHKIQSFEPDHESTYFKTNCISLYSTITKFEIIEQKYTEQTDEMEAPRNIFWNDGPMQSSQTFSASETIKESFSVDIGTSLNKMQKVNVENSFEVEHRMKTNESESDSLNMSLQASISASSKGPLKKLGVNLGGSISGGIKYEHSTSSFKSHEAIVKEGLKKAYENESTINRSRKCVTILESTKSVSVSQVLNLPPCSKQVVHAYVNMAKNSRIKYRALVKISGRLGTRNMTANEVRKFMDAGMQFVGVYDQRTILAYSTTGLIKAEYGVTTLFISKVQPIPECLERYNLTSSSAHANANLLIFLPIILHPVASFLLMFERLMII